MGADVDDINKAYDQLDEAINLASIHDRARDVVRITCKAPTLGTAAGKEV